MSEEIERLKTEAQELSVPLNSGIYKPRNEAWVELEITEYELHRRINEEKRHRREHRLWIVAVISALIAFISLILNLLEGHNVG